MLTTQFAACTAGSEAMLFCYFLAQPTISPVTKPTKVGESGHSPDNFSLDIICSATVQVWRTTNTVAVGPMCGLQNYCKTSELS